mmetsp:Transcript_22969/g.23619  ORF Transcript_22969/g.23619 Transcript_22969/m.23619 type:complete len:274 (+) Transcript_22969:27-848(+)
MNSSNSSSNEEFSFFSLKSKISGFLNFQSTSKLSSNNPPSSSHSSSSNSNSTNASDGIIRDILGIRVVMISDTHNDHRSLIIPPGDILIHAGDWTCYGNIEHTTDFNEWLGTLPHQYKIVVNGNHESNAVWKRQTSSLLSNATFLQENSITLNINQRDIKIYGSNFYWPMKNTNNPNFDMIPLDTDILIVHGPAKGFVDGGGKGCPSLRQKCLELAFGRSDLNIPSGKLRLVVCGHIHYGYGIDDGIPGLYFVNASMCRSSRKVENEPLILDL